MMSHCDGNSCFDQRLSVSGESGCLEGLLGPWVSVFQPVFFFSPFFQTHRPLRSLATFSNVEEFSVSLTGTTARALMVGWPKLQMGKQRLNSWRLPAFFERIIIMINI